MGKKISILLKFCRQQTKQRFTFLNKMMKLFIKKKEQRNEFFVVSVKLGWNI